MTRPLGLSLCSLTTACVGALIALDPVSLPPTAPTAAHFHEASPATPAAAPPPPRGGCADVLNSGGLWRHRGWRVAAAEPPVAGDGVTAAVFSAAAGSASTAVVGATRRTTGTGSSSSGRRTNSLSAFSSEVWTEPRKGIIQQHRLGDRQVCVHATPRLSFPMSKRLSLDSPSLVQPQCILYKIYSVFWVCGFVRE